ncbi:hypothetical protein DOY81_007351, partial [Sarcophaga bullata]
MCTCCKNRRFHSSKWHQTNHSIASLRQQMNNFVLQQSLLQMPLSTTTVILYI